MPLHKNPIHTPVREREDGICPLLGWGRTGTVVGCWLVRHECNGDEVLDRTAQWWREMEKVNRHPRSPETMEQREYVRRWIDPHEEGPR